MKISKNSCTEASVVRIKLCKIMLCLTLKIKIIIGIEERTPSQDKSFKYVVY